MKDLRALYPTAVLFIPELTGADVVPPFPASFPMNVLPDWISSLVGDSNFDQMLEDGMTWEQMNEVLTFLLQAYGLSGGTDEAVGESEPEEDSDDPK